MDFAEVGPALVAALADLPPCSHLCSIHEGEAERLGIAALFMRLGLERYEQCIYVANDASTTERIQRSLIEAGIDVEREVRRKSLILTTADKVQRKLDSLDPYRMYIFWKQARERARQEGFGALRCASEIEWTLRGAADLERWIAYESHLTDMAAQANCTFLCQHQRRRLPSQLMLSYIRAHPSVIHGGMLARNIYHASAEEIFARDPHDLDVDTLLSTLRQHERSENVLRQQRDELRRNEQHLRQTQLELETLERQNARVAAEELNATQAALAQASRLATLGELTASIAHEVAQPLASIIVDGGAAMRWLAELPPDLAEARIALARLVESGRRATNVIERIRALSRKTDWVREQLDVSQAILEVIALLDSEVKRSHVTLLTHFDTLPWPIHADRVHFQQVVLNLLMNALEAIRVRPEGPRQIIVSTRRDAGNGLHVTVRDSGIGLPAGDPEQVFKSFFTTKPHGTGLGLSISRVIVEAHEGRLWAVRNENGPGTTLHFTLPGKQSP